MRKYTLIILLFTSIWANAQMSVMLNPIQGTALKVSDIFNGTIQNSSGYVENVYLTGNIINSATGAVMVSAKTGVFELGLGSTVLNESSLSPLYDIKSQVVSQTGTFPFGSYQICLHVSIINKIEDVAQGCQSAEVNPISPPLLISPQNQKPITEQYPMLLWLPPMPVGVDMINYDLKVVEILPNQTAYDALQRNFSVLEMSGVSGTSVQYPANAIMLEDEHKYAWKVVAKTSENKIIGETEVWWFEKKTSTEQMKNQQQDISSDGSYTKPEDKIAGAFVPFGNRLLIEYTPAYAEDSLNKCHLTIFDLDHHLIAEILPEQIEKVSEKRYEIDTRKMKKVKRGDMYLLVIKRAKGKDLYIPFKSNKDI